MTVAAAAMAAGVLTAGEGENGISEKLEVQPTGRAVFDGAVFLGGNDDVPSDGGVKRFVDGVGLPDLRLGAKASFGRWRGNIDLGFAYGKVGFKDIFIQYQADAANSVRMGYFISQFGLQTESGASHKASFEEPTSNQFFAANTRHLGLLWQWSKPRCYAATTVFVEGAAALNTANTLGKEGWGAQTRLVWRPLTDAGRTVHAGCSFNYATPTKWDHTGMAYSATFPAKVSQVTELSAGVDNARGQFKMSPELLLIHNNLALEAQYYYLNVARKGGEKSYSAHGAYGLLRWLPLGGNYAYSYANTGMALPGPKSLEVTAGYDYTNASDADAGIWGGIAHDASCTFTYYINKWVLARLRYSYTTVRDLRADDLLPRRHVNAIQARVQVVF